MLQYLTRSSRICDRLHVKYGQFSIDKRRFLFSALIDVFLGILVTISLSSALPSVDDQARWVYVRLFQLSDRLEEVISWLSDNPAGLKLNAPLNETLARFFGYHVHLWRTYIAFMQPFLTRIITSLHAVCLIGGLTLQLVVLRDIISVLTIHIFCFHVYAERLWQLQSKALVELWRLFRGKKYNPFRKRVDYALFDNEQLFLGTLLFTFLLFLVPTTLVYYAVMSALRCSILCLQYILQAGVWMIDKMLSLLFGNDTKSHVE